MDKKIIRQLQTACDITYNIPGLREMPKPYRKNTPINALKFAYDFKVFTGGPKERDAGIIGLVDLNKNWFKKYDIVIAFRGTVGILDWLNDFKGILVSSPYSKGKIHKGFLDSLRNLEEEMYEELMTLVKKHPLAKIYITGHSKGGALATLMGQFIISKNKKLKRKISVVTFGSPRVGNKEFSSDYDINHYRYESFWDIVPHLPFSEQECLLCEKLSVDHMLKDFMKLTPYVHVGKSRIFKKKRKDLVEENRLDKDMLKNKDISKEELISFQSILKEIRLRTIPQMIDVHVYDYDDIPHDI